MDQLPEDVMNKITDLNFTTYDNEVVIEFSYDPYIYESRSTNQYDRFGSNIAINLNDKIDYYWKVNLSDKIYDVYRNSTTRNKIQSKLKNYKRIFGQRGGLIEIEAVWDENYNENQISLYLTFMYEKEVDEDGNFKRVDFMSERGLQIRKAAAFLTAHTASTTLEYIIPAPDTSIQGYVTFDEDGKYINKRREEFYDYKLHSKDEQIYSPKFWIKQISYDVKRVNDYSIMASSIKPTKDTIVTFTLVNNKRLPITRGEDGVWVRQLKF